MTPPFQLRRAPVDLGIGLSPMEANRLLQVLATYLWNDTGHGDDVAFARELHDRVQEWIVNHGHQPPEPECAGFHLRYIYRDGNTPREGVMTGHPTSVSGGPWSERGEAEEVAAWLNRRARSGAFYYASTRSPLEP